MDISLFYGNANVIKGNRDGVLEIWKKLEIMDNFQA